jgi:hypothetical protein
MVFQSCVRSDLEQDGQEIEIEIDVTNILR